MLVDLRSDSEEELNRLDEELHKVIKQAVEEENARWDASKPQIKVKIEGLGVRQAGAQPKDCAIVKAAFRAAELLGIEPEYRYESSTDDQYGNAVNHCCMRWRRRRNPYPSGMV